MTSDDLAKSVRELRERSAIAKAAYAALTETGKLRWHVSLTYRCPRRCALLHVINLPQGVVFGWPRYKTSPAATAQSSSPAGRRANTEDGDHRWKRRAAFATDLGDVVALDCDHLRQVAIDVADVQADLDAGHAEVTVSADGERRA